MAILIREIEDDCECGSDHDLGQKMKILREQVARCKQALSVMSATAGEIRAESGHVMPLTVYLDKVIDDWYRQLPGAKLHYEKAGPLPAPGILAELTLTHALINILNNAAEVSPKAVELHARWDHHALRLNVLDQGPGIAPAISEQLGKKPISTKDQGLGVGLFLAFSTIHRLGGSIEMTPRTDAMGTLTKIVLPLVGRGSLA